MQNQRKGSSGSCGEYDAPGVCAQLISLLESSPDLIFSVDLQYRLLTFNRAFSQYLQSAWKVDAKAGMTASDLLPTSQATRWPPMFARAVQEGPYRTEYTLQDGRWLELCFNLVSEDHEIVGISVFGKDITERKLAEEFRKGSEKRLRESEARFRTLVDEAPSAFGISRNGVTVWVNRRFVEMFRLESAEQVVGRPLIEQWAPDWRPFITERIRQRAMGIPVPTNYEGRAQRPDGSQFPIHIAVSTVDLADGPATLAIITDISEQKAAEKALHESEARFRSYFNLPLIGMAMTSPEKGFIEVNDRICEILGYSREELMRSDWATLTHPDDLQANLGCFKRMLAGELDGYSLNKRFIRKDGRTVWTTISVGCVRKPDGSVDYACLNVQDISERLKAEEALQASESRFRTLVESAPGAIGITRGDNILYVNQRCAAMFGFGSPREVVGRSTRERFDPETNSALDQLKQKFSDGSLDMAAYEGIALRADASEFPVHIEAAVVQLPDGPAILSFLDDITDRKAAEEAIREAERRYRDIFTEAPEGIVRVTKSGELLALNPAGAQMLRYDSPAEALAALGKIPGGLWLHLEQRAIYADLMEANGEVHAFQCEFKCKDGSPLWVALSERKVADATGQTLYYQGFFENLSEKKRLEQELKDHIREIRLLSEMNDALLRASTEEDLLREYCRIVVETGGYRMAWVGFADPGPEKLIVPLAHYGHEDGYLKTANVRWDDSEYGNGPIGQSIKSGEIMVSPDFCSEASSKPWHEEAAKRGYQSLIAIPFRHSEAGMACLAAYGSKGTNWSGHEFKLLEQIAAALGFGITTVRTAMARDRYQRDLHQSLEQTIKLISETVEQRDPYTAGHQRRVADLCARIAEKLGLDPYRIQGLRLAATIHDLGKIAIPAEILAKPGLLTPIQFELVREHAELGFDIIKNVSFPWPIGEIIRQHHERLNGSGYPRGLEGDAILLESRILAVADVVEAMASHRPYRATRGIEAALAEVVAERGKLYDSDAVDACVTLFEAENYVFPT